MPNLLFYPTFETHSEILRMTIKRGDPMKKIFSFVLLLFLFFPANAVAKSFTVDQVQIRGWVQSDGDMLVNEVFTYTFDGSFSRLTRSFPEKHIGQITNFEAYILNDPNPVVGEIDGSILSQVDVTVKGNTYSTSIRAKNETLSVLYSYKMKNAVTSYDTYSDLAVTYFEDGENHDEDYNELHISYALPGDVGKDQIYGFIHDRKGVVDKVYRNGISFYTAKSIAYTDTKTRMFFPSAIMSEQQKLPAPIPIEEAIKQEQDTIDKNSLRWSNIPVAIKLADGLQVAFIVLIVIALLMRQRLIPLFGNIELVLQTDPMYLAFVDQNGKFNRKIFLSGLFSLVEKGLVKVEMADSATRFQGEKDAPEKTLVFHLQQNEQLNHSKEKRLPHEQYLITWLFKGRAGYRKFHLHDMAGPSVEKVKGSHAQIRKQMNFQQNHEEWHRMVLKLMKEAGALSTRLSKGLKLSVFFLITMIMTFAFYADGAGALGIAFPAIVTTIGTFLFIANPGKKWPAVVLFIGLFFTGAQTADEDLTNATLFALIIGAILYPIIPKAIPSSLTAYYTKMSISKFRLRTKFGIPPHLPKEDIDRWIARAYLLNKSKKKLPQLSGSLPDSYPLAPLFALQTDPLHFAYSTWSPASSFGSKGGSGSSSDGGGFYSGGGDGGDGGGGAGAD